MSTYYYAVCDKHRMYCDAISRTASNGVCWLHEASELLPSFLFEHVGCPLRLASEHEQDLLDDPREGAAYQRFQNSAILTEAPASPNHTSGQSQAS